MRSRDAKRTRILGTAAVVAGAGVLAGVAYGVERAGNNEVEYADNGATILEISSEEADAMRAAAIDSMIADTTAKDRSPMATIEKAHGHKDLVIMSGWDTQEPATDSNPSYPLRHMRIVTLPAQVLDGGPVPQSPVEIQAVLTAWRETSGLSPLAMNVIDMRTSEHGAVSTELRIAPNEIVRTSKNSEVGHAEVLQSGVSPNGEYTEHLSKEEALAAARRVVK